MKNMQIKFCALNLHVLSAEPEKVEHLEMVQLLFQVPVSSHVDHHGR